MYAVKKHFFEKMFNFDVNCLKFNIKKRRIFLCESKKSAFRQKESDNT